MAAGISREINIVLKVQNIDAVKAQLKGLIPKELGQAAEQLNVVTNNVTNNIQKVGGAARVAKAKTEALADGFGKLYKSMLPVATFYGIRAILSKGMGFVELGGDLERARNSFGHFVGDVENLLPGFRSATRGAVDDLHLLKTANRAVAEGIKSSQLTDIFKTATAVSRRLGLTVEETVQTVSNAIARQDESALTSLGVILKTNKAFATQMELIGKMPGPIHGVMQIQARHALIMGSLNQYTKGFNGLLEDGREKIDQFKASWDNLKATFGTTLSNIFGPMVGVVGKLLDIFTAGLQILNKYPQTVRTVVTAISALTLGYIALKTATLAYVATQVLIQKSSPIIYMIGLASRLSLTTLSFVALRVAASSAWTAMTGPIGIIAMLGSGIFSLMGGFEGLSNVLGKIGTGARVIFQMLSNLDEESGLTKVLKKDKEELGGWFNVVTGIAQGFYMAKVAVQAFGTGLLTGLSSVMRAMGIFEDFEGIVRNIFSSNGPLQRKSIDQMSAAASILGERLGNILAALSAISVLVLKVASTFGLLGSSKVPDVGGYAGRNYEMTQKPSGPEWDGSVGTSSYSQSSSLPPQNQIGTTADNNSDLNRKMLSKLDELVETNYTLVQQGDNANTADLVKTFTSGSMFDLKK